MGIDSDITRRRMLGAAAGLACFIGSYSWSAYGPPRTFDEAMTRLVREAQRNGASGKNDPDAGIFATVPTETYAPRLAGLAGRVIGFVSTGQKETDRTFALIRAHLERAYGCTVIDETHFTQGNGTIAKEGNGIAEAMAALGVEGAILGNAGCSHCATAVGRAAAQLELAGIPTAIVAQHYYEDRLSAAFADFGLPAQPTVGEYVPLQVFEPDSDLSPLEARLEGVLRALVSWKWTFRTPRL